MTTHQPSNVIALKQPSKAEKPAKNDNRINLTKSVIDKLPYAERDSAGKVKQKIYWDKKLGGYGLVVGLESKTFIVQRDIAGRTVRLKLDLFGVITPEQARKRAQEELVAMGQGINPNVIKQEARAKQITLSEALKSYKETRKNLSEKTRTEYSRLMQRYLADWLDMPLGDISQDMVAKRHAKIAEQVKKSPRYKGSENYSGASSATGQSAANDTFRALRAIFNNAKAINPALPENPVKRLSMTRAWYPENRRTGHIKTAQLGAWLRAVAAIPNDVQRDFLLLVLLTGLRRNEAAAMEWRNVDLKAGTLHVSITKNKKPLDLPLSTQIIAILSARQARAGASPWVFPADSASGHISEPRWGLDWAAKQCGISVTTHDLRRTFITIAEAIDVPVFVFKAMVNHSTAGDVTGSHYIQMSLERMRPWMQKISDEIMGQFAGAVE